MSIMKLYTAIQKSVGTLNNLAVRIRNEEIEVEAASKEAKKYAQELLEIIKK